MFPTQTIVQSSNLVIVYIHDISYTRIQFYSIHSFIVLMEHSSDTLDEDGDDDEDQIIQRDWWLSNNYILI